MESPDKVGGILHIFLRFPTCGFHGVVKARPFNKVKEARAFLVPVNFAVQDPLDFILIGVVYLQRGWRILNVVWD